MTCAEAKEILLTIQPVNKDRIVALNLIKRLTMIKEQIVVIFVVEGHSLTTNARREWSISSAHTPSTRISWRLSEYWLRYGSDFVGKDSFIAVGLCNFRRFRRMVVFWLVSEIQIFSIRAKKHNFRTVPTLLTRTSHPSFSQRITQITSWFNYWIAPNTNTTLFH